MVNKKNSRKSKQTSRQGLPAAAGTTNSAPANHDAASPRVDAEGRMQENQGRRVYGLWKVLAAMVLPKLNAERASVPGTTLTPLQWNSSDIAANSMDSRNMVMTYILQEIDWLAEQVENSDNRHNQRIIQQVLGRRVLSKSEKEEIHSWKLHVKDDFFVLGHIPGQGTVLVQVGRLKHQEHLPAHMIQDEYHEPRVFVVQGLATSFAALTASYRAHFQKEHPSLQKKYPEFKDGLCMVHTALLPYSNGITYMSTMSGPQASHYTTPQDMAAAMDKAVQAYRLAFPNDSEGDAEDVRVANSPSVALFRSLDPVKDAYICRLTSNFRNQNITVAQNQNYDKQREKTGATPILVNGMLWKPYEDRRHPRYDAMLEQASNVGTGGANNSKPFLVFEGFKNAYGTELLIDDHEPCPFHRRSGQECPSFAGCCKSEYLKRSAKAKQKANYMKSVIMYNPIGPAECENLQALAASKGQSSMTAPDLRIGFQDMGVVKLKVPPHLTHIIKERMDTCGSFHSTLESKWIYWGYLPIKMYKMGVMTFGDISLDPETGIFEAEAMTAGRLAALIAEMKCACFGIPVLEASLEMQPSYKIKPDPVAFEKNKALLQDGLDFQVRALIDTETNEGFIVRCGFCGISEDDGSPLLRCACKSKFYCCKVRTD
jgi:hypothetical protein